MKSLLRVLIACWLLVVSAAGGSARAMPQDPETPAGRVAAGKPEAEEERIRTVVAGDRYRAGGFHRWIFGDDYRDLWTTPIEVEILDLESVGGGLEPEMTIGRNQTLGLALRGADGNSYTFRSVNKDPTAVLPEELLDTPIADLAQDQISSNFPGAPLVAAPIARAAGIRQPEYRLAIMPDSPRLGEFREQFAGLLGTFHLFPTEGTWGATEIIDGPELIERLTESADERVDARAFLRARLVDLLLGDWDRHIGQWRWARIPGQEGWQPIPEDRDQAFSRYDGLAMSLQRNRDPRFDVFGAEYPSLEGFGWNGRTVDRRLLTGLEREDWLEVARDLRRRLDDDVLEAAVRALPGAWRELRGAELLRRLQSRRDALVGQVERFYRFLAAEVDVWGTNEAERITVRRTETGLVEVEIADGGPGGSCEATASTSTRYRRRFSPRETDSVRIYTGEGGDRVLVRDDGGHEKIEVKIVGDGGGNTLCVAGGPEIPFGLSSREEPGPGTEVAAGIWLSPAQPIEEAGTPVAEQGNPKDARRDWGSTSYTTPWFAAGPDLGLFVGTGWTKEIFGFREHPYAAAHTVRLGFSTGALRPKAEYLGVYHLENRRPHFRTRALVSGIETLNFFGVGNETPQPEDGDFARVKRNAVEISGRYVRPFGETLSVSTGPVLQFSQTQRDEDDLRLVNVLRPYGVEDILQMGWTAGLHFSARERIEILRVKETDDPARFDRPEVGPGISVDVDAAYYPDLLDLREDYLRIRGSATAIAGLTDDGLGLGLRIGGQRNFGDAPYYDLALLGEEQVRGLQADRFAGDASVYGNALVAVPLGRVRLVVPGHWGLVGQGGIGRVYLDEESSSRWHWGAGGGVWWTPWDYSTAVRVTVAHSDEGVRAYLQLGFGF